MAVESTIFNSGLPWEWEWESYLSYGNSHSKSCEKSYRNPEGNTMENPVENPMGNSVGNPMENPVGIPIAILCILKFTM